MPESDKVLLRRYHEEGDLSAIGVALEQFHHAVTDRRVTIGATASDLPRKRAI